MQSSARVPAGLLFLGISREARKKVPKSADGAAGDRRAYEAEKVFVAPDKRTSVVQPDYDAQKQVRRQKTRRDER